MKLGQPLALFRSFTVQSTTMNHRTTVAMFSHGLPYAVFGLALGLLSCSESSGLFSSKQTPCALMTVADAERALGEPVQEGVEADPTTCVFKAQRSAGNTVTVQLDETSDKDRRTWFNKERLRRDSHLIPGLGDGAVRIDSSPTLSRLIFMHKNALVTVILSSTNQTLLSESVTELGRTAAARYGASLSATLLPSTPPPVTSHRAKTETVAPPTAVTLTRTLPVSSGGQAGPKKSSSFDPASLVGTWHTHLTQGTTQHDLLLIIRPNLTWSLSSMLQFDGVLNAEAGQWSLERVALRGEAGGEGGQIEVERLEATRVESGDAGGAVGHVERGPAAAAGFGDHQRAGLEVDRRQADAPGNRGPGRQPAQPTGNHQVQHGGDFAGVDHDALAKPPQAGDRAAGERRHRRVDGADQKRSGDPHPDDRPMEQTWA